LRTFLTCPPTGQMPWQFPTCAALGVAQAFDLADITNTVVAPSFAFLARSLP
jgi:hypothetical protein